MQFSRRGGTLVFLLIGLFSAGTPQALADQVYLTNGDRISGKIIALSRNIVEIDTAHSGIIRIARTYIERLSTEDPVVVELVSGERVIGRISAAEPKMAQICSPVLGELRFPFDAIAGIGPILSVSPTPESKVPGQKKEAPVQLSEVQGKGTGPQSPGSTETSKPRSIGQKPEDEEDIRKIFLRQSTVLLRPGQVEVEAAFSYSHTQSISSILNARFRQFQIPLSTRVGLFNRVEGYVTVPAAYAHRELAFSDNAVSNKKLGVGDATAGFNYEMARETARRPDIITSFAFGASTGSKPNEQGLSLGSGHWAGTAGLQFIKTVDPVAIFWGISYAHQFGARYFLNDAVHAIRPGEIAGYNFGFGFAVNENTSLSTQLSGSYESAARADGSSVFGSSREPVTVRSALTYRYSRGTYIEPSVAIGLNSDSPNFILGIFLTHRFGK
jgi:hypothetical protein